MSNAEIAELLSVAYAFHCAECEADDRDPVSWERFAKLYNSHIQDFRNFMGAADPLTG